MKKPYKILIFVLLTLCCGCSAGNPAATQESDFPEAGIQPALETETPEQKKVQMTFDDLRLLSEKGDSLQMEDFAPFEGQDIGSGLYVLSFELPGDYVLHVGSGALTGTPLYAELAARGSSDGEDSIDIRYYSVDEFVMNGKKLQTFPTPEPRATTEPSGSVSEPPELTVRAGGVSLPVAVGKNIWDGAIYDRIHTFQMLVRLQDPSSYPRIKSGEAVSLRFEKDAPKNARLDTYVLDEKGEFNGGPVSEDILEFVDGAASFAVEAVDGSVMLGYLLVCEWGGNEAEYGFALKAESENSIGVSFTVEQGSVTASSARIVFDNATPDEHLYGSDFQLERKSGGGWEAVEPVIENYGFNSIGYSLPPNKLTKDDLNWEWLYGELAPGEYRVMKSVILVRTPGDYDSFNLTAEFAVTD